jgi:hypothetical protein
MTKSRRLIQNEPLPWMQVCFSRRGAVRLCLAGALLLLLALAVYATPVSEYHKRISQAVTALDSLVQSDEIEDAVAYEKRRAETLVSVRTLLPESETVEWNGESFKIDNSWVYQALDKYAAAPEAERDEYLKNVAERLQSIDERLAEIERPFSGVGADKSAENRKLAEILQRKEYARKVKDQSALSRLFERLFEWLRQLMPTPKPVSPGSAMVISRSAQVFVIVLALGVLAFVLKLFLPRFLRSGRPKKQRKTKARIVLGERLEPDQSALDLLSEAEALARRGELRAAIRKAYIGLLLELGERKIISLAQYKTNRDYLRAVRKVEPLYGNVKQLTESFERHWYGLAQATETDWLAFRSAYKQALSR